MRNSVEITIGKTHPTLFAVGIHLIYRISINMQSERKEEVLSFNTLFVRLLWIFMDRKMSCGSLFVTLCVSIGLNVGFESVKTSPKTTSVVLSVDPLPEPEHLF